MRRRKLNLKILLISVCLLPLFLGWHSSGVSYQSSKPAETDGAGAKNALKNWLYLCAPCHSVQATGTDYGPPLLGPKSKQRRLTSAQLVKIFAHPESHGLAEAVPAFKKLTTPQREEMAVWFAALKVPEDIVIETDSVKPPPFSFVQNCSGCHGPDATGGICPNLHNIKKKRSREELLKLVENPQSAGIKSQIMPTFDDISLEERTEIVDWLLTLD